MSSCSQADQCVDDNIIVDKFADHFRNCYTYNNAARAQTLRNEYALRRFDYQGMPLYTIDTELVSRFILDLHCRKAPDITGLTAEHLIYSHPSSTLTLAKFFQLILISGVVSAGFKCSYIVPVLKIKDCRTKAMSCDDFRGITTVTKLFTRSLATGRFPSRFKDASITLHYITLQAI